MPPSPLTLGPLLRWEEALVRVGTCSWTDPTLVKETAWYPKKSMSAAERLAFYAARFPVVEADSTYYRPPTEDLTRGWAERTPPGFRFDVKAYSLLTGHPTRPETVWEDVRAGFDPEAAAKKNVYAHHLSPGALEEAWRRFVASLAPLHDADRLGGVLFQYPPWFTPKRANREELARVRERMGDLPVLVELRSPRWVADDDDRRRTLDFLADHDLTYVAVDAPPVSGLPAVPAATAGLAVVRFHGRADSTWKARTTTAAERFKYLYDDAELAEWVPRVQALAAQAGEVQILMNNCYQDYGVRNAADIYRLLLDAGAEPLEA